MFYETEACRISLKKLETKGNVTVVGAPGDGKTAIGIHLALEYYQRGYKIYNAHSVHDVMKNHTNSCPQIFLIDDPIGVHVMDDEKMGAWVSYNTEIQAFIQNGGTKLIATVRKNIMNTCQQQINKTILVKNQVDLTMVHFSTQEKEGILLQQAGGKINKNDVKHLIEPKYYPAFPLLCHFIVNGSKHISNYSARQQPTSVIYNFINELTKTQTVMFHYCALVIVAMHDGKFDQQDLDDLEDKRKLQKIIELCGIECKPSSLSTLGKSFDEMLGIYLTEAKLGVEFLHDRIYSAVVYHFGSRHLSFLWKNCSSVFIRDMIRSENASLSGDWSNEDESNLVVRVKEQNYESFAKRLTDDLRNGNVVNVFLNPSLQDVGFQIVLADQLLKLPILDLKNLLCHIPQNTFKEKSTRQGKTSLDFGVLTSSPFHWICKLGLHKLYTAVLGEMPDRDIFVRNIPGHTSPLHFAAGFGHLEIVKSLIELGADVNSRSKLECDDDSVGDHYYSSFTPIFYAVRQNHLEVADFLLRSGANPDMVRDQGAPPMLLAADKGHHRMIKTLLDYSADPNICCYHGTSPLFRASKEGHKDAVRVLIEGGAIINYQNIKDEGLAPLHIAVKNGHYSTSKTLLDKGADPNLPDSEGNTPLHVAVSNGKGDTAKLLLVYGGDPNLPNKTK
ncbi:hypothetical protein FSP39_004991 [Pinctada imbricata]|uniref:Novel STAND NTPase 3 domain-containing protein n=1 Tax=Pinctada imbricata TaxID=66713 RepID=A0AA88XJI3_PINIB|nr:hypothetical protein FSP39_004991 [Pinctada imbricata]